MSAKKKKVEVRTLKDQKIIDRENNPEVLVLKSAENNKIKSEETKKNIKIELPQKKLVVEKKIIDSANLTSIPEEQIQKSNIGNKKGEINFVSTKPVDEKKTEFPIEKKDENSVEDKNKVEALLFASGKYLEEDIISELCNIDKKKLHKILDQLKKDYESRENALTIFNESTAWKINVREKYLSIVRKIVADTELPKSVMETLAVIAWKSPIYQSEVVNIRGNKCYDHIEVLEEAGFILKDKKGRSYILKTTDKFYNYFEIDHGNLKSVFEAVKIPVKEEQKTLDEDVKIPENITIEQKIEQIQVKKWSETDEERESHSKFLEEMDGKIKDVQNKNILLDEEFPSRKKQDTTSVQNIPEQNVNLENQNTPLIQSIPVQAYRIFLNKMLI